MNFAPARMKGLTFRTCLMIYELNNLEISILDRLSIKYPFVKHHIPFLKVATRENTGVGMYVNFIYDNPDKEIYAPIKNSIISTNEIIGIEGLKYGLGYEVDVTDGRMTFIELVTHGEEWNGILPEDFTFAKWDDK